MTKTRTRRQWAVRILKRTGLTAVLLCVLGNVVYAFADGSGQPGQTIPTLSWIQLTDDKGINLWQYELSINFKKDVFEAGSMIAAMFTQMLWQGYLGCAAVAIWFIDWVLSFDWLNIIVGPLRAIGDALRDVIGRFGLMPAFLMISGLVGAMFIFAGKTARGLYEILVGAFIVALAATALSNPIDLVAGPDGLIYQTRDRTLEFVAALGEQAQTDQNSITSDLIETFIRQPVQVISFGQVLDGTECEETYDKIVASGPYGYENNVRDAVNGCNPDAGKYAETPNLGMFSSVMIQGPAGLVVMLVAVLLGGTVMLALVSTIMAALKTIINLALAALPGGARRSLAQCLADIGMGLAMTVFAMFFLAVYMMVIQKIYSSSGGQPSRAFAVTLIFMIMGLIAFWRYRKSLKAASARMAEWLSKRPGGGAPRPLAAPGGSGMVKMGLAYGASKVLASPKGRAVLEGTAMAGAAALTGNPALAAKVVLGSRGKGTLLGAAGKAAGSKVAAGGARSAVAAPRPTTAGGRLNFGPQATPLTPRGRTATSSTTDGRKARLHVSRPGDTPPSHRRSQQIPPGRAPRVEHGRASTPRGRLSPQPSQADPQPRQSASTQRRSSHGSSRRASSVRPSNSAASATRPTRRAPSPPQTTTRPSRAVDDAAVQRPTERVHKRKSAQQRSGQQRSAPRSPAMRRSSAQRPRR